MACVVLNYNYKSIISLNQFTYNDAKDLSYMGFLNIFWTPLRQKTKPTVNINEDRENKLCNHQMRNFVFKYLCLIRYG